jgi:hypothetical protein
MITGVHGKAIAEVAYEMTEKSVPVSRTGFFAACHSFIWYVSRSQKGDMS